ncbi:MAG: hypothetical protein ACP5SH_00150 [Syntrophobacteraceae bacterium]
MEREIEEKFSSDYVIDLGSGSGEEGGRIVAEGIPEEIVAARAKSLIGRALTEYAKGKRGGKSGG